MALRGRRINNFLGLWCLVASGGLHICVSSTSFQKNNMSWPQQLLKEEVQKFNMIFHDSTKNNFFQNVKIKLNSNALMTLKSSVVVFQALKLLQPQWPQRPQQPQWPHDLNSLISSKKVTDPDDLIIPSTQMTNTSPFLWNWSSKIQFFIDICYSSWRGCWGQPMSFFWKLVDKTQMCNPPEDTRHHSLIKLLILLPLRAIYFRTFQCEIPCRSLKWRDKKSPNRKGLLN